VVLGAAVQVKKARKGTPLLSSPFVHPCIFTMVSSPQASVVAGEASDIIILSLGLETRKMIPRNTILLRLKSESLSSCC
jgi:hypothetical protein